MATEKKTFKSLSVRVPKEIYEGMEEVSKDNDRSMTKEVCRALEAHIAKHRHKKGLSKS